MHHQNKKPHYKWTVSNGTIQYMQQKNSIWWSRNTHITEWRRTWHWHKKHLVFCQTNSLHGEFFTKKWIFYFANNHWNLNHWSPLSTIVIRGQKHHWCSAPFWHSNPIVKKGDAFQILNTLYLQPRQIKNPFQPAIYRTCPAYNLPFIADMQGTHFILNLFFIWHITCLSYAVKKIAKYQMFQN